MRFLPNLLLAGVVLCGGFVVSQGAATPHTSNYTARGSVTGTGTSRGAAHADALSRLPLGAVVYQRATFGGHTSWTTILYWRK